MIHLLNAADNSSKMKSKEMVTGLSNMEVTGALIRGKGGGAVVETACMKGAPERTERIADSKCSQLFRE